MLTTSKRTPTSIKNLISKKNFHSVLLLFWLFFFSDFFSFKTLHIFSPPCRNHTLAKLQDAKNITPTLHHWWNTLKLCMVQSFMHQKEIMKQKFPLCFWFFFAFKTLHTFSPPCRNRMLAKLQDAQNLTPTLHHWEYRSKLCMELSLMHQKDISNVSKWNKTLSNIPLCCCFDFFFSSDFFCLQNFTHILSHL